MKRYFYFLFVITIIIFFLLNSKITLEGSSNGLILWLNTVVPTLLPFMIMSSVLINLHGEKLLHRLLSPVTSKILGLSPTGSYVFFIGMFCGYPLGAKTAADLLREERISAGEARYLMNFCNNISPAFAVGFICNTLLNNKKIILPTLIILYGVPIFMAVLTKKFYFTKITSPLPQKEPTADVFGALTPRRQDALLTILDNAVAGSALTALKLGGYIILFSIFCSIFEHTKVLPDLIKTLAVICLEVTTGCRYCVTSPLINSSGLMLPALLACATFGGLSGIAQTSGMITGTDLSVKNYIFFRALCAVTVFIISYLIFIIL